LKQATNQLRRCIRLQLLFAQQISSHGPDHHRCQCQDQVKVIDRKQQNGPLDWRSDTH